MDAPWDADVAEPDGPVEGLGPALPLAGWHRRHRSPAREHVVKVRYDDWELAVVRQAAGAAGLRPCGYVASAALTMARQLLGNDPVLAGGGEPGGSGRPRLVSEGEDQLLMAELIQARLALRRYGVNLNQAAAVLNSGGPVPVWLELAVAGGDRAVARVDEAAAALARRLA